MEDQLPADQKLKALTSLAGGVVFAVNNFLATIEGYAQISLEQLDPAHPVAAYLAKIKQASERAQSAIRELGAELRPAQKQ
jgi:signal transduction histidine kinase